MTIREEKELAEEKTLSEFAVLSSRSLGRAVPETPCDIRMCFQRDRDRIIHSKAFRRLMHKTQVFISPEGDHFRTRLTHTLEVNQISRTIASALRLNENLTEAIALGHDLGHTPFGHIGEADLNKVVPGGFRHNEQSVRIVEKIENKGKGLNLSREVIDGILNHRGALSPKTLEGKVVQISDKIAYVNHDIDDAIRAGIISEIELPIKDTEILGHSCVERIDYIVKDIIYNSLEKNDIIISPETKTALYNLREYLFENVYFSGKLSHERHTYGHILGELYYHYMSHFDEVPDEYTDRYSETVIEDDKERIVADFISGMTDRFAINKFKELKEN
ncbi:MAG TPA: deoxyguanosinetriphosphate triphosphohydrolase [Lachnospiraceae bacterium]|nr:deoxyguanosinetriphosphate triphosphohydrolase [Lachnospiraceae bacterium]